MHCLIIGYVWPEPNSSAAGRRMQQLIQKFQQQGFKVTFASPARRSDNAIDLEAMNVDSKEIPLNDSRFNDWVANLAPDVVIFDRYMMEEQFGWRVAKAYPQAIRILNTEDLHALRKVRQQMIKTADKTSSPTLYLPQTQDPHHLIPLMNTDDLTLREVGAILRSDLTLMISQWECDLLQNHFFVQPAQLLHLPFLFEKSEIPSPATLKPFSERQGLVFIGNFRHDPNWDAVLQLKRLWPALRQKIPGVKLHIYGAYPPPKAQSLHNEKQGFLIQGWAKDALKVIQNARLMLAPIRFGAGIKGKMAEAMMCGTPSVTTPIGAEDMADLPLEKHWPGAIAIQEDAFIEQTVKLYQSEQAWLQAQQHGLTKFRQRYVENLQPFETLFATIQRWMAEPERLAQHRQSHFLSQLLNHHHHRSTQYFSQWIEEKNRNKGLFSSAPHSSKGLK